MKAVVCQNAELSVVDLPEPKPAQGQVLVEVLRCGICGSDLHLRHHCDHMKTHDGPHRHRRPVPRQHRPQSSSATSSAARCRNTAPVATAS